MYKGYVNAGYTIQIFHEIGNDGVAIGVRSGIKDDPAPFVVWNYMCENGVPSFYWGDSIRDLSSSEAANPSGQEVGLIRLFFIWSTCLSVIVLLCPVKASIS